MGLYEELSESYPEEMTDFGACLLIPHSAFRPEWNEQLKAEGVKVFQQSYNGKLFFFLKKPNSNSQGETEPKPSEPAKSFRRFEWTQADLEALKRMREQGLSLNEIARKLNRTKGSVLGKLRSLKEDSNGEVKPQIVNCEGVNDGLFKEYLEASELLYPRYRRACAVLLREASRVLENG